MSSNTPCAVYNFYNCCGPTSGNGSGSFIWQSANILDPSPQPGGIPPERLTAAFTLGNSPSGALKAYLGLTPLHRNASLKDISLIRLKESYGTGSPLYTATIMFNLVVLDFNGAVIRTISTAPMNYQSLPLVAWAPISLSTVPGDLDIPSGQLVAGELTFGAPLATGQFVSFVYQLSGTGVLP